MLNLIWQKFTNSILQLGEAFACDNAEAAGLNAEAMYSFGDESASKPASFCADRQSIEERAS